MDWLFYEIDISVCAYILLALVVALELKEYFTKKQRCTMHETKICSCCGLFAEVDCECTVLKLAVHAESIMDDLEKKYRRHGWTNAEMVKHLRDNGYKVEKRKPNPKKRKRAHRKLVQFKDY